jgi:hypothetical protein
MADEEVFEDGFLGADVTVEDQEFGSAYAVVQWVNGDVKNKKSGGIEYTGGFFLSADQGVEPPDGWKPFTLMTQEGQEIAGYATRDLNMSPIRTRRCWDSDPGDNGLSRRFPWSDYEDAQAFGSPSGKAHVIVGVEGFEEPLLLAFRGMVAKRMMGQGRERGIIPMYGAKVKGAAKRIARKKGRKGKAYPLCAFKLNIGPQRDAKGAPEFTKVGQGSNTSNITYPVWLDEPKGLVDEALLNRVFVGNETLGVYQDWHTEAEDWVQQWSAETLYARRAAGQKPTDDGGEDGGKKLPGEQDVPF